MTGNICIVIFHGHFELSTSQIDNFFLYFNNQNIVLIPKKEMFYFFL